jgi:hypothetical protein
LGRGFGVGIVGVIALRLLYFKNAVLQIAVMAQRRISYEIILSFSVPIFKNDLTSICGPGLCGWKHE